MPRSRCLILLILLFTVYFTSSGQQSKRFYHIVPKQGDMTVFITSTYQDSLGLVWMSYFSGICEFNGYRYKFHPLEKLFPSPAKNEFIKQFWQDQKGRFWIVNSNGDVIRSKKNGTYEAIEFGEGIKVDRIVTWEDDVYFLSHTGGLYRYNGKSEKLATIPNIVQGFNHVINLLCDGSKLFLSTENAKVYVYNIQNEQFKDLKVPVGKDYDSPVQIALNPREELWIATERNGIFCYDLKQNSYKSMDALYVEKAMLKSALYISLFCDSNGKLWAGTDGEGLFYIDIEESRVRNFIYNHDNQHSISGNTIVRINEDRFGNIWSVLNSGEISICASTNVEHDFKFVSGGPNQTFAKPLSLFENNDVLWIGLDGQGLKKVSLNTGEERMFFPQNNHSNIQIQSLTQDNKGVLWIGTYRDGLWLLDGNKQPRNLNRNFDVRSVFAENGRLWLGCDKGLCLLDERGQLLHNFNEVMGIYSDQIITQIQPDRQGGLWLCMNKNGLLHFTPNYENFSKSELRIVKINGHDLDRIIDLDTDKEGNLWLVTFFGEMIQYQPKAKKAVSYSNISPFDRARIGALEIDEEGSLWLTTYSGLIKFNPKTRQLKTFYKSDGLQSHNFIPHTSFHGSDGNLYFGNYDGIVYFRPNEVQKVEKMPRLFIESIEVLNKPAIQIIPEQLAEGVAATKHLDLKADQSSFSFSFIALSDIFDSPHTYAYRLKGFNDEWIQTTELDRKAVYTNIPAGNYRFEVKAGNRFDQFSMPPGYIDIHVQPTFWQSRIAFLLYAIAIIGMVYALYVWWQLKNKLVLETYKHQHEKDLYDAKMNFFVKMSHEIQTPLTLILAPMDDMLQSALSRGNLLLSERLNIIKNNAKRLSRIADELTSIRDKELGNLQIKPSYNDVVEHIKNVCNSFYEEARSKRIDFIERYEVDSLNFWYDFDKLEHVLYNLLSNAFKFTPNEGKIVIKVKASNHMLTFSVIDSGPGIEPENIEKIFIMFYQSSLGKHFRGMGVGLSLAKELVKLHKGEIRVNSFSNKKGTEFEVQLPTNIVYEKTFERLERFNNSTVSTQNFTKLNVAHKPNFDKTILIVEDDQELREFLTELLAQVYKVELAENGQIGLEKAHALRPSLIISDVMMPQMDGISMSREIKASPKLKHIPIILMTAKNSSKSKYKGLKIGAVEFIRKPFDTRELVLKIKNILSTRDEVAFRLKSEMMGNPKPDAELDKNDIFLNNLVNAIQNHLEDPDFKLKSLAKELNLSYSALYRKCLAITGMSLVEYVRDIKLKKGLDLLVNYNYSVADAAFKVGFNDPKYFSKCIKKAYGLHPMNLKKEAKKLGLEAFAEKYNLKHV